MEEETGIRYNCAYCGEENETFFDPSGGTRQTFTEDCAVCCRPNVLTLVAGPEGDVSVNAEFEG